MTLARYDGAHFAPAARLRGHGALRRGLDRAIAMRESQGSRAISGHTNRQHAAPKKLRFRSVRCV